MLTVQSCKHGEEAVVQFCKYNLDNESKVSGEHLKTSPMRCVHSSVSLGSMEA